MKCANLLLCVVVHEGKAGEDVLEETLDEEIHETVAGKILIELCQLFGFFSLDEKKPDSRF